MVAREMRTVVLCVADELAHKRAGERLNGMTRCSGRKTAAAAAASRDGEKGEDFV